ncbi:glycoside hydrolase superfamily [Chaetomidium leptoderma]|uniref:Glycoside hydrolase superfamily n=1 Tax=Chaetomidium leptoderma TaxID=669021 RepID=A0AAN6VHK7_9PEZI|nr:glycoside hydrolase superfamily [Chaetomidium leptoderma]
MKHLVGWTTLVLYGISATAALTAAEVPTSPAPRTEAPLFTSPGYSGLDGTLFRPESGTHHLSEDSHQAGKRQTTAHLTPAHLAGLLAQLQVVYGQLSAFSATRDTGLLNNLLGVLGGVVPPLSDVLETLRAVLIGDSVTVLDQLAIAQAIGVQVLTVTHTTTITVHGDGAAAATGLGVGMQLSQCLPYLTTGLSAAVPAPVLTPALPSLSLPDPSESGLPGFSTSVIPTATSAVARVTAPNPTNAQSSINVPSPSLNPTAPVGGVLAPVASVFNPRSPGNVAVHFGHPGTEVKTSLAETCADPSVDIIILGFLTDVTYGRRSIYPRLQLSPCLPNTPTTQMRRLAPGLSFYPTLETDILRCQTKHGKKILLSIGGEGNTLPLASDEDAITFANHLWALFGPAGRIDPGLRPFGSVVLDGFDLNKQDECAANYDTFAATLRSHFLSVDNNNTDTAGRDYFLSAAPGCSFPDISIHPGYLAQSNFVWPRFYNDSKCGLGSDGFLKAVERWSSAISDNVVPMRDSSAFKTRLYIGLPAELEVFAGLLGGMQGLAALVVRIKALVPDRFGGITVSDGALGLGIRLGGSLDGMSLLAWIKGVLRGLL